MGFFEFIWYCIKCMIDLFYVGLGGGSSADGFGYKEALIGAATTIVLAVIIFLILWATGIIKFKKKH